MTIAESVTITQAAHRLGMTWHAVFARVLKHELVGECVDGRWRVSTASVEKLAKSRARTADHEPAAVA